MKMLASITVALVLGVIHPSTATASLKNICQRFQYKQQVPLVLSNKGRCAVANTLPLRFDRNRIPKKSVVYAYNARNNSYIRFHCYKSHPVKHDTLVTCYHHRWTVKIDYLDWRK